MYKKKPSQKLDLHELYASNYSRLEHQYSDEMFLYAISAT
ncbi:hypothetical protein AWA2045_21000 [Lactiplantibacillus plantarum]|nr:hypothetical protein AWA2045_21000 [Lactiplantibacillus plantarum]